jgi:prepilin-type N-terminal cleavage/methylation domain-containing protein
MTAKCYLKLADRGFTLLEIVITLVVASVLGAVLAQYMNTVLARSTKPIDFLQKTYSLNQVVELITADYQALEDDDGDHDLTTLQTNIQNGNITGNNPYYGKYTQVTKYIKFDGGSEALDDSGDNRVLKATITSTLNEQVIAVLFTK